MRKLFFLGLVLSLSFGLKAQYYEVEEPKANFPQLSLKVLPSALLGRFPTYTVALQQRTFKETAVEYRFGWVFDGNYLDNDHTYFFNKTGFKTSVMFQVPLSKGDDIINYFGVEPFYNNLEFDRTRTFEMSCGINCGYFTEATYGITRQDFGVRINYGVLLYFSSSLFAELSFGLGAQASKFSPDERKPTDFLFEYGDSSYPENERRSYMAADLALKIGFVILK
jgi:hypothetical protein